MEIIFDTPRLWLREFTEADAPLVYQLNSEPAIFKYLHGPVMTDIAQAHEMLVDAMLPQYRFHLGRWAIHAKSNDAFLGWCGLKLMEDMGTVDLGYRLLPSAWGKGYATEAARYTLQYGFQVLQLEVITGMAHVDNTASLRVLEKIGMQFLRNDVVLACPVRVYTRSRHPGEMIC